MHAPLSSLLLLRPYRGLALALLPALLLMALIARPALAEGPTILYVDADAAGNNDGASWADAYTYLQDALDQANANGSTDYEIWVAEGVYYPDEDSDGDHTNNSESEYFTLRYNNVRLYGGFVATETERSQRDWAANLTILSGDIDGNDTPPGGVITDTANIQGSNADHVLYLDGETHAVITSATVIDGFTITAGQANGSFPHFFGGGLYCAGAGSGSECSPSLANLRFSGNSAASGGGIHNRAEENGVSSPSLAKVSFSGNSASEGGGMLNYASGSSAQSSPNLANVTFSGNTATNGGGMYNRAEENGVSSPSLTDVSFSGNSATSGGGMYNRADDNGVSSPSLTDVTFSGNTATTFWGGGMLNYASGSSAQSSPSLTDVIFSGNSATSGGGMHNRASGSSAQSSPSLANVSFSGNSATSGGGMYNYAGDPSAQSSPSLANVSFSGNSATNGGGMYNYANDPSAQSSPSLANVSFSGNSATNGGGMYNQSLQGQSSPSLTNVTFSGNSATTSGGGMYNYAGGDPSAQSSPSLANVILWGNAAGSGGAQVSNDSATPVFSYTLVEGGISGSGISNVSGGSITDGGNNFAADPLFVAPITATSAPTTTGNYRLQAGSPAIDRGDNSAISLPTDLDGSARIQGGTVDLGAYEFAPPPSLTAFSPTRNAITTTLNSSVVLTYSAAMSSASVTSRTVAIHSMMRGLITQTHSVSGAVVTVDPPRNFFPGELVYASATTRTTDLTGTHPLTPTVWQFTAAAGVGPGEFPLTHPVTTAADGAQSVGAADVDGDGDIDLLSASSYDDKIAWYENDGSGSFTTVHTVTTAADGANSVAAADVDGDGDIDLLSASRWDNKIAWYENDGSGTGFITHTVTTAANFATSVGAADVDGDGDLDILSASANDGKIAWYENDGASDPTFTPHTVTTAAAGAHSVAAADVDGDGDIDLLSASSSGSDYKIVWYENDGAVNPTFTAHIVTTDVQGAKSVGVADVDGDGDLDLLSASEANHKIAWYENDGAADPTFTAHTVTLAAYGAQSVGAADVDGDGDLDLLAASLNIDQIAWYENDGATDPTFTLHPVTAAANGANSVGAADVDGDGDLDLFSASENDDKIAWYENVVLPDVTLVKSVSPASAPPGAAITYTLTFSNIGSGIATGVVITDSVPVSVTNVSVASSGGAITQTGAVPNFVWQVEDLLLNEGGVITLTGILTEPLAAGDRITNTAAITATADSDAANNSGSAGLTVLNAAPLAGDDRVMVRRDDNGDLSILATQPVTIPVLLNDSDPNSGDSSGLTVSAVGVGSQGGTVAINSNNLWVDYTPAAAFTGTESFTYTVSDGGLSATASVTVTVVEGDGGTVIDPGDQGGETLVIPGTGFSQTITVTVQIPAGSAGDPLTLVYKTVAAPSGAAPAGFVLAGLSFTLDAYLNQALQPGYVFATPISLTIDYSDEDVAALPGGEESLELRYWDGSAWSSDGVSKLSQDTVNNRAVFQLEHLSEFALFGRDAGGSTYLPLIQKAQ